MTFLSAALLLFLVMDPLGNIPLFLTALKNVPIERRVRVILRELFIALGIMVLFLFSGQAFLSALNISEPALTTTGGVILFLIAIKMIFPSDDGDKKHANEEEPFIVPLAIPYVAGPSALATLLLIMKAVLIWICSVQKPRDSFKSSITVAVTLLVSLSASKTVEMPMSMKQ